MMYILVILGGVHVVYVVRLRSRCASHDAVSLKEDSLYSELVSPWAVHRLPPFVCGQRMEA